MLTGIVSVQAQAPNPPGASNTRGAAGASDIRSVNLDELSVEAQSPTFGTDGFVATRSTAGTKGNGSILETPATVSVITREELDVRGVQDINTAVAYTPNVYAIDYPGGQGAPSFTLRGFRSINFENVYEDGLRYGFNAYDQNIEPYAYERIDVVKGPISVLYGAGQPGGIVNLVSKRPSFIRSNEVYLQGGSYDRVQGGFDLTGPVVGNEQFAYRFTGLVRKADTQVAYSPDDRVFLAPSLTWKPDADTSLTILGKYANYRRGGSEQSLPIVGSIVPSQYGFFKRDVFVGQPNFNKEQVETKSIGYVLDHTFAPDWILHSAARFTETSTAFNVVGFSFLPDDRSISVFPYLRDQSSESIVSDNHIEGRFDTFGIKHNVVFGVDFQNYVRRDRRTFSDTDTLIDLYDPAYPLGVTLPNRTDVSQRQISQQTGIYAQDQMKIGNFILTGSIRNDWFNGRATNLLAGRTLEQDISAFSYRGAVGYELIEGVVPYVAYSTSFNPQLGQARLDGTLYEPTEARQIEGGVKYQPLGSNALYTASYFEINQTNILVPDQLNFGNFLQIGEARSSGFELEGKTTIADGLNLIFGFAHINATVIKDTRDGFVGRRLPNVPENAVSLFVDYALPVGSAFDGLRLGGGVRYVGARTDTTNIDHLPSYALVDASISYDLARLNPGWKGATASVTATNLFDQRYFTSGFYQGTVFEGFRRTVLGTVAYRW